MIRCTNRHESEIVSTDSDPSWAGIELASYLHAVARPDYAERVLTWWDNARDQPFVTNNTIDATPETDPDADTWEWIND